ncbi:MAG: tRNA pseudouridine(54/55) synthase Pus10 [Euryarchaeota archaeon]|nr:tRNA pseudouridine(54/55) synthase Pus10 [Euryarchaeota archaeon]
MAQTEAETEVPQEAADLLTTDVVQNGLRAAFGDRTHCLRCLGRPLSRAARGTPNATVGKRIAEVLGIAAVDDPLDCAWCEGLFEDLDRYVMLIVDALAEVDHETFVVGTRFHPDMDRKEAAVIAHCAGFEEHFEPIRGEMNREVGGRVQERTQKTVQFERPEVTVLLDPHFDQIELTLRSVFIFGRYRKFDRTVPQTKWPCRSCRGHGCARCAGTGKTYETSVEELVAEAAVAAYGATDESFHGAGREDIDALMLGTGRPFVLELKEPRYRKPRDPDDPRRILTLEELEERINAHARPRAEVEGLRPSDKDEVIAIKEAVVDKAYRAHVVAEAPVRRAALDVAIREVIAEPIQQRTPERVAHRRADKVRPRSVHRVEVVSFGHHARATLEQEEDEDQADQPAPETTETFTLDILAESGTYIKELVHSDEGRTQPSFAAILGIPMKVAYLDVVGVGAMDAPKRAAPSAGTEE